MAEGSGINSMLAHKARVGDDTIFVRTLIGTYTFATYGKVTKYEDGRVDVSCGSLHFTNIEVLIMGVNGWGIKPVVDTGDIVLLIGSQTPILKIEDMEATGSMPPYDVSGLKAIPVTTSDTAQLITVSKDGIEVTGDTQLSVNSDGVSLTDVNGNTIVTASDGVTINGKLHIKGGS